MATPRLTPEEKAARQSARRDARRERDGDRTPRVRGPRRSRSASPSTTERDAGMAGASPRRPWWVWALLAFALYNLWRSWMIGREIARERRAMRGDGDARHDLAIVRREDVERTQEYVRKLERRAVEDAATTRTLERIETRLTRIEEKAGIAPVKLES